MALNGLFCADVPLRNYSLTLLAPCKNDEKSWPICKIWWIHRLWCQTIFHSV